MRKIHRLEHRLQVNQNLNGINTDTVIWGRGVFSYYSGL